MSCSITPDTDSLYIELKATPGSETLAIAAGLNVDLDAAGEVVGFDIDLASKRLDLSTLETVALPLVEYQGCLSLRVSVTGISSCPGKRREAARDPGIHSGTSPTGPARQDDPACASLFLDSN